MGRVKQSRLKMRKVGQKVGSGSHSTGSHKGQYGGFSSSTLCAPLRGKVQRRTPTQRYKPVDHFPAAYYRTRPYPMQSVIFPTTEVENYERNRWWMYVRYNKLLWTGINKVCARKIVCDEQCISDSTLLRLLNKIDNDQFIGRKVGSGTTPKYDEEDIEMYMKEKAKACRYLFSQRDMAAWVREKFGFGSLYIVQKIMKKFRWRKTKQLTKPLLTKKHMNDRLDWSRTHLRLGPDMMFGGPNVCYVHIDEKWFYLYHPNRSIWLPQGVSPTSDDVISHKSSKRHIPKVMFLAAIGFPVADKGFDGNIGIWPVTYLKTATRDSIYHNIGDVYEENQNMDTNKFISMMKELVIPEAIKKVGSWATKIVFQMDAAGGHGVKKSLKELTFTDVESNIVIETICQPAKSPDLNVLDLGAWYSLQVAVDKAKRDVALLSDLILELNPEKPTHRIIDAVRKSWNEWVSEKKISKLFRSVIMIMTQIVKERGGNNFEVPHSKKENVGDVISSLGNI